MMYVCILVFFDENTPFEIEQTCTFALFGKK